MSKIKVCQLGITYFLALSFFFSARCVQASASEFERLTRLSLEELLNIKVSIASKSQHNISNSPSTVSVFSRNQIDQMGIKYLYQLMNFIPGFQATREILRGDGAIVAGRGQSTPQESYHLLVMIDGQRLNDDSTGGTFSKNHFITLENAERIEVIRGPGSALYGTSAFVGVINIITSESRQETKLAIGNNQSKTFSVHVSKQYTSTQLDLFAQYYSDEGESYGPELTQFRDNAPTSISDPRQLVDIYTKLSYKEQLKIHYRYKQSELSGFFTVESVGRPQDSIQHSQQFLSANYQLLNTDQLALNIDGTYARTKEDSRFTGFNQEPEFSFQNYRQVYESEYRVNTDGHFNISKNNIWTFGLSWRNPKTDTSQLGTNANDPLGDLTFFFNRTAKGDRNIFGAYLQNELQLSSAFHLTLGIRRDNFSDFGDNINPRAALIWKASEHDHLKLLYGQAFRAPAIVQSSPVRAGNPNLRPETIETYELAWLRDFELGQLAINYFQSTTDDLITTIIRSDRPGRIFENVGSLETSGIELELQLIIDAWRVRSTFTHLMSHEENPRSVAKNTASINLNYHRDDWNFNIGAYYHDDMEQLDSNGQISLLNSYIHVTSKISYYLSEDTQLFLQANNLFDEDYASPSKRNDYPNGLPNRGLALELGIQLNF